MNKYSHYCSSKRARLYIIRAGLLALIMFLVSINAAAVHSVLAHLGYNDRAMLDKRAQEVSGHFTCQNYLSYSNFQRKECILTVFLNVPIKNGT
jgi:hypothetical protein